MGKTWLYFEKWNACKSGHCVLEIAHPFGEEKLPDLTFPQTTLQKSAWLFMIMKFL
jgi:hypothetical protein